MVHHRLTTPQQPPTFHTHHQLTKPRVAGAIVTAATVLFGTTAVTTTALTGTANAQPTPECAPVTAVMVPGTTETNPGADPQQPAGMLASIGEGLASRYGNKIDVRYLPYAAAPAPYKQSESGGTGALSTTLSGLCASTRVVTVGYSQGADVVGDQAAAIGNHRGPIPESRVIAAGLIADPKRNPDTAQLGGNTPGQGIAGTRPDGFGTLTGRVRTTCAAGDMFCSTSPEQSPAIAAVGHAFTGNPTPISAATGSPDSNQLTGQDPATVTGQVIAAMSYLAQFAANIPPIIGDLAALPPQLAAGDIPGAHRTAGDLNNNFQPLVTMANTDLALVAQGLHVAAPMDPSGWTGVAAEVTDLLARLDIKHLAGDIGTAQDIGWQAADKLTHNDPVGGAAELANLVPVAADLAATTAAVFTGDAASHLTDIAGKLTDTSNPDTQKTLGDLAAQGQQAAQFATSGVHQKGYDTGKQQMLDWLTNQIDQAK